MEDVGYVPPTESRPPEYRRPEETKKRGPLFWAAILGTAFFFACTVGLVLMLVFVFPRVLVHNIDAPGATDAKYTEVVLEGSGVYKILTIPVEGIISNQPTQQFFYNQQSLVKSVTQQLDKAASDSRVKAVILEINSPGGGITATDILYNEILKFRKDTGKKVIVHMKDVAASGGYYIAAGADKIVAHPTTITGSIGVIMTVLNLEGLFDWAHISQKVIKSGRLKDIGSPNRAMTEEEEQLFQEIIMEMQRRFVDVVARGRNMTREDVEVLADGRMYTGEQAEKNGLVDFLGYMDKAIELAKKEAGIDRAKIIRYRRQIGLSELIFTLASGSMKMQSLIDADALMKKQTPTFMYLWAPSLGSGG